MELNTENLSFLFGVKLKTFRQERGFSLKDLAERTGLSISYLSEIEKGKKYPKPEKIVQLAETLDVSFDEMVSMKVGETLNPLKDLLDSEFIQEFPFHMFGIQPKELLHLMVDNPDKARALVKTFLEISRVYDVRVEHFLFAVLRSLQQLNGNYFDELEQAALTFRQHNEFNPKAPVTAEQLQHLLERSYGYQVDDQKLTSLPELEGLRSVWFAGPKPSLLINGRLLDSQKAFVLGRELGYCYLKLTERPATSSWVKVESFEQVLNAFKASYFAGAILMEQNQVRTEMEAFFKGKKWDSTRFLAMLQRFNVTPEMFFYRLTELLPQFYNFQELYFLRFNHRHTEPHTFRLTKILNLTELPIPHDKGFGESYCRRWSGIQSLRNPIHPASEQPEQLTAVAQRVHFLDKKQDFFVITVARSLVLSPNTVSSVSLGIRITDQFRELVRFADDPKLPLTTVNLTCERCPLPSEDCHDRSAPAFIYQKFEQLRRRGEVLEQLGREYRKK
ncbi:MAG: helix-turn-helix domain-containing protein [Blastocatellia bacterium]|nr:helix-turn-helix domain-containing protein [Blastocatellia bacterium]